MLMLLAATAAALALRRPRRTQPPATSSGKVCVLAAPAAVPADRDASWAVARLIARSLERLAGVRPVHGYRVLDRVGWDAEGLERARRQCRDVGATRVVIASGHGDHIELAVDGAGTWRAGGGVAQAGATLAIRLARHLGAPPHWQPPAELRLPDAIVVPLLRARERVGLLRFEKALEDVDAVLRDQPQLLELHLLRTLILWWRGALDTPEQRAATQAPAGDVRVTQLVEAIKLLAAGQRPEAGRVALGVLEDRRWGDDPIALYLAGEALFHGDRPGEGTRYLRRALDLDPEFRPAAFHLEGYLLAAGDFAAVQELAMDWERFDPSDWHAVGLRARIALAQGRYREAAAGEQRVLSEWRDWNVPGAGLALAHTELTYAIALEGRVEAALEHAEEGARAGADVGVAWTMVEPVAYALSLARGDRAGLTRWSELLMAKMGAATSVPANVNQVAYMMALVDLLGGEPAEQQRSWLAHARPTEAGRTYRFADHAALLDILAAQQRGDAAALAATAARDADGDPSVVRLAHALAAELRGELPEAARHLETALSSTRDGEFDCVVAAAMARVQQALGHAADTAAACRRVQQPWVARPYCIVLQRGPCAAPR